ncbi:hypothetical protein U9M48_044488 [Paspalum notatum var. saurae]|uniref:DDE Tnp4 domain-containing protein n=1 Tax=Paspalum notatum var. saurae TaxID=547442 RepID=A0AAQ3XHK0_PASNO
MSLSAESDNDDTSGDRSYCFIELVALGAAVGAFAGVRYILNPEPPMLPHVTGRQWVQMNLQKEQKCYDNFRMQPDDFLHLNDILVRYHGLQSTQEFDSLEGLGMFLWACATGQPLRQIKDRFDRSLETVTRKMGEVAEAMIRFSHTVITPKDPTYTHVHHKLYKFAPYFDGCIGALDGTHIPAQFDHNDRPIFLNSKGDTSYNVLAIVDMDMCFTYVGSGIAGSCHDMAVLWECQKTAYFPHPPRGKYYLVDSGHTPQKGYLAPYRGTDEETMEGHHFNMHHASIRSVVEQAFGVLKAKWRILRGIPHYDQDRQAKFIIACCALHNFVMACKDARQPATNITGAADYGTSAWVDANAETDMEIVRRMITDGLYSNHRS